MFRGGMRYVDSVMGDAADAGADGEQQRSGLPGTQGLDALLGPVAWRHTLACAACLIAYALDCVV